MTPPNRHPPPESERVLIVEDSPTVAISLMEALENARFAPFHAPTLEDALKRLATRDIGIVLLDLSLPDASLLNGLERVRTEYPDIPVVILTSHDSETLAMEALTHGAQD